MSAVDGLVEDTYEANDHLYFTITVNSAPLLFSSECKADKWLIKGEPGLTSQAQYLLELNPHLTKQDLPSIVATFNTRKSDAGAPISLNFF